MGCTQSQDCKVARGSSSARAPLGKAPTPRLRKTCVSQHENSKGVCCTGTKLSLPPHTLCCWVAAALSQPCHHTHQTRPLPQSNRPPINSKTQPAHGNYISLISSCQTPQQHQRCRRCPRCRSWCRCRLPLLLPPAAPCGARMAAAGAAAAPSRCCQTRGAS